MGFIKRAGTLALYLLIVGLIMLAPAVGAPKHDQRNGGPNKVAPSVTVTHIDGSSISGGVSVGDDLVIAGTGFTGRSGVFIVPNDATPAVLASTDREGSFSATWTVTSTGVSRLAFYQMLKKGDWEYVTLVPISVTS